LYQSVGCLLLTEIKIKIIYETINQQSQTGLVLLLELGLDLDLEPRPTN
jgi:hypothetical protein